MSAAINAQPGSLDYSFGDSGKVVSKYFGNCYSMKVQTDDKIVCSGINDYKIQVVRYLPDGIIDSSFGNNGIIYPNIPETNPQTTSMFLQPDQKILIASDCYKNGIPTIVLMRLLPNGSLDESFGTNGIIDSTFGIGESIPSIALQPNGQILLAGWYYPGFILIRFNADGSIDESFGEEGKVITDFGSSTVPTDVKLDMLGNIIVSGDKGGTTYSKFLLAKYSSQGVLDKSFGNNGVTTTDFGKYGDYLEGIAIQSDSKIIGVGVTGTDFTFENENIAVVRYNTDGSLDKSFGSEGKITVTFDGINSQANSLLLTPDNKVLIGGGVGGSAEGTSTDFTLIRLLSNGALDSSFGVNGKVITDFGLYETGAHIAFQNNKIMFAGTSYTSDTQNQINYALARYNNDGKNIKQIIITKIKKWLQHHNGFIWDANSSISSYTIQRSYDGIHFNSIARINAGTQSSYTYEDATPLNSDNYYRLQTTSTNGVINYSNIIAVTNSDVKISPNPATNTLVIQGLPTNKTKITVVDFTGNEKLKVAANNTSYNLNIASLKAGNYLLKIEMNDEVVTKKFLKE